MPNQHCQAVVEKILILVLGDILGQTVLLCCIIDTCVTQFKVLDTYSLYSFIQLL